MENQPNSTVKPRGGTEILKDALYARINPSVFDDINLIVNSANLEDIDSSRINVLWMHHNCDQPAVQNMMSRDYLDKLQAIVFVSHWQYEKFVINNFPIQDKKVRIIKNAIEPIIPQVKERSRYRLIYSSTPWRGLEILLDSFALLKRDDTILDIYSSGMVYGQEFSATADKQYRELYEKARSLKNVTYTNYAPNEEIRNQLSQSHILAYPSIWQETSCLCAIEAAMAGCNVVTTNFGALTETLSDFARFVQIDKQNRRNMVATYAAALNSVVESYWTDNNQKLLEIQHNHFRKFWSWEHRIKEWTDLFQTLKRNKIKTPNSP